MVSEELLQRGYIQNGILKGEPYGLFEYFNLGSTTVSELYRMQLIKKIPESIDYPFSIYKPQGSLGSVKPDKLFARRTESNLLLCAIEELKQPIQLKTDKQVIKALEQALLYGAICEISVAIVSDTNKYYYIDVNNSLKNKTLVFFDEDRDLNPAVLEKLLSDNDSVPKDPSSLAERVWQAIWHATKQDPKPCLMTFVEVFIFKFLSDNLPKSIMPESFSFYELTRYNPDSFEEKYGKSQIEYYVQNIRPKIKSIFPEKTIVVDSDILEMFGLGTIISEPSIINGFAFLESGETSLPTFNRTFIEILKYFQDFGPLVNIHPEFKLRLYEIFLKKTPNKQKLGQFFTPRNIVKSMIKMANISKLREGAVLLDPAAGVGGFILETLISENGLKNNFTFESGKTTQRIRLIGIDVDPHTHVLAKSNALIHLAEEVRDPKVTIESLNELITKIFLLFKFNQHLGSLEYPIIKKADLILTNPPYVTKGSRIYKNEISSIKGLKNGIDLKEYYDRCGLGLESLFLRYISGALKPGGKAFVIVPQGMLTRSETSLKETLLSECNLIASIALPRNAFFTTPQKTYILVLQKRYTLADKRPNVFCGFATSIGESLDARRIRTPEDNTLNDIAEDFTRYNNNEPLVNSQYVKIVDASEFLPADRWDVQRYWSEEELVNVGNLEEAIDRISFLEEIDTQISQLTVELHNVREEINKLEEDGEYKTVSISNQDFFKVRRGKRVTRQNGLDHPGSIPVYSGSKYANRPLCKISEKWAEKNNIPIEENPILTVNANGYVGATFVRKERCIIHDDVMIIEIKDPNINFEYMRQKLRGAIASGNYEYEAKLYNRVKELSVEIPLSGGVFDLDKQKNIAIALKKFDNLKDKLCELGTWGGDVRIRY